METNWGKSSAKSATYRLTPLDSIKSLSTALPEVGALFEPAPARPRSAGGSCGGDRAAPGGAAEVLRAPRRAHEGADPRVPGAARRARVDVV